MKIVSTVRLISSIYNKYIEHVKQPTKESYINLYSNLSREEIDMIITQDYPKQTNHRLILKKLKQPIEVIEIDHILLQ